MKASMKSKSEKDCAYKKGGAVKAESKKEEYKEEKKEKKAMKVGADKSKKRLDKFKRGGAVTPKSPLSGAMPSGLPSGGKAAAKPDKEND